MTRTDIRAFLWIGKYLRPYKWVALKGVVFLSAAVLLSLLPPLMIREMVDNALPARNVTYLLEVFGFLVAVLLLTAVLQACEEYYTGKLGLNATRDIRVALYQHIQFLPSRFFLETKTGEVTSRFTSDIFNLHRVISKTLPGLFTNSVMLIGAVILMVNLNPLLTLAAVSTLPLYFVALYLIVKKNTRLSREAFLISDKINGNITDNFSYEGQLHARVHSLQERNLSEFASMAQGIRNVRLKIGMLTRGNETLFHLLSMTGIALVYLVGGMLYVQESVSIGTIVAFSVFVTRLYQPLSFFSTSAIELSSAQVSAKRLTQYFALQPGSSPTTNQQAIRDPVGKASNVAIEFDAVDFSYVSEDGIKPIFNGFDLVVPRGAKMAITGENGTGKSTLTQLIAGIYAPQRGNILVNNCPVSSMNYKTFSEHINVVFTHSFFTNGSILDNLIIVNANASADEIDKAMLLSESKEFVSALQQGLHTRIGQGGYKLSSGQRQRLAIARLLLNPAPIVICDEVTSNLSADAEQRILTNLLSHFKDRTVLIISHNPHVLKHLDRVITLGVPEESTASPLATQFKFCQHVETK